MTTPDPSCTIGALAAAAGVRVETIRYYQQLSEPGGHCVFDVAGESIVAVRNPAGTLRAFYNVCRHRGAHLCRDSHAPAQTGRPELRSGVVAGRRIVCPYHQWSYDLDGRFVAAPHLPRLTESDKSTLGLYPVGVDCGGGFVFVNLTPIESVSLATQLGEIPEETRRYPLQDLRIGRTNEHQVDAEGDLREQ